MRKAIALMLCISVFGQGCATIFKGTTQDVSFNSYPEGARLVVNGIDRGITPAYLEVDSGKNLDVRFIKEGYQEVSVYIQPTGEAGWIILDLVPGILLLWIPFLVDAVTGAWYNIEPDNFTVTLSPDN